MLISREITAYIFTKLINWQDISLKAWQEMRT